MKCIVTICFDFVQFYFLMSIQFVDILAKQNKINSTFNNKNVTQTNILLLSKEIVCAKIKLNLKQKILHF